MRDAWIVDFERELERAQRAERDARGAVARVRAELQVYLAAQAIRAWWGQHQETRQIVDSLGVRWVVRSERPSTSGQFEDLELVRPVAHVQLRGDADPRAPRRRLAEHRVTVIEETRRASLELSSPRPHRSDDRTVERARLAAGDRD